MATKKELLEKSQKSFEDFINLSKYILCDDAPYDINEIPEDNQFYKTAREISDEMGLDWNKMSHDESNRVMLNLLSEYFCSIKTDDKYIPVLTISFKKSE